MQVLVVLSQKGGSGKTTLAGHIAVQAELSGAGPVAVLVHRHRRMIHLARLQDIENIRIFFIFVNLPKESVH